MANELSLFSKNETRMHPHKLGLVLSGGGAKGAYEVGVLKTLVKFGFQPHVISGASIGSLNGAILASHNHFSDAVSLLEDTWCGINTGQIVKLKPTLGKATFDFSALLLCALFVAEFRIPVSLVLNNKWFKKLLQRNNLEKDFALLDQNPLEEMVSSCINFEYLLSESAPDFYAAVYPGNPSNSPIIDSIRYLISVGKSDFLRLKDHSLEDAKKILLASAAIPLAFSSVDINGKTYRDGGMGDRVRCQGNTPATPLAEAGCTHAIVVMLDQYGLWDRYEWPSMNIIEIRPSKDLGGLPGIMNFSPDQIRKVIDIGEADAERVLKEVAIALGVVHNMRVAASKMKKALESLRTIPEEYNKVMSHFS